MRMANALDSTDKKLELVFRAKVSATNTLEELDPVDSG